MEGEKVEYAIGDKVSVTFRVGRQWITLFGTVDAVNSGRIRVRHTASWDKSKTTTGWFTVDQVEPLPENWTEPKE